MQNTQMRNHYELPTIVAQQAGASGLGAPLGVYRPLLSSNLAIIGMVVGLIAADILLLFAFVIFTGYLLYVLIYTPVLAIVYGIYAFTIRNLRVYEFSNGLILVKSNRMDPIRWDQVTSVTQQQRRRGAYYFWGGIIGGAIASNNPVQSFTVHRADGASFKFTGALRGLRRLHQNVQQAVTRLHLPKAIATYNSGAPVPFGPFTVSLQGLSNGRISMLWEEVQNVEIKQGQVIIKKAGKALAWAKINISQIPNLLVFMGLVHYARTGRTSY